DGDAPRIDFEFPQGLEARGKCLRQPCAKPSLNAANAASTTIPCKNYKTSPQLSEI
ncbi:hypothetical protein AVEN_270033-1, partial [Araneus ventricosus]